MFIINLTYKADLEKIDQYLDAHKEYLSEQYQLGHFLASGRKIPRTGGIILAHVHSQDALERILEKDPFKVHGVADYELTEFAPSMTCEALKFLIT